MKHVLTQILPLFFSCIESLNYYLNKFKFLLLCATLTFGSIVTSKAQTVYWSEVNGLYGNPLRNCYGADCMAYNNGLLYVPYYSDSAIDNQPSGLFLGVWDDNNYTTYRVPDSLSNSADGVSAVYAICIDNFGNLYLGGTMTNEYGENVIKWDGHNWTSLGYGVNGLNANYYITSLACDSFGHLYAGGDFTDTANLMYVAEWNGTNWNEIGRGTPLELNTWGNSNQNRPVIWCYQNYVYAKGFDPHVGGGTVFQWDGNSWTNLDSALVLGANVQGFCVAPSGRIYADLWSGIGSVAVWNGNGWNYLPMPPYMTQFANAISIDAQENVYLSGAFVDQAGYSFIYKWDGNNWSELGTNNFALHANNYVSGIVAGGIDNIYAIGNFTDSRSNFYIAESSPLPPGRLFVYLSPTASNCGNTGSINTTVYQGTPPYIYAWSNGDVTANIDSLGSGQYFVTVTDANGLVATGDIFVPGSCKSIISGTIFSDTAGTCNYTGTQQGISNVILTLSGDSQTLYATTDVNGNYSFAVNDTGKYYLYVQVGNSTQCGNFILCGNPLQAIHVPALGDSVPNNNFAFNPTGSGVDLYLHPGWTTANPGFEKDYWIYFANNSLIPFADTATVVFKYDSNLIFLSSDTPYTNYYSAADSLTWKINSFTNSGWNFIGKIRFRVPPSLPLGYQLQSIFRIYPYTGDCDTSNNYLYYSETVKGSHDPNYKEVSPTAAISNADPSLTYTIHYQNTGTDSTYFITVTDTLSTYLDPATVRNLASSIPYTSFNVSGTGLLTWMFLPCSLPDSATDPSGSQGFITFSVKKRANALPGSAITNTSAVFFDYATPVITNTVIDSVVSCHDTINLFSGLCAGDSVYFYGRYIKQTGLYDTTLTGGCDTLVALTLVVQDPLPLTYLYDTICANDSVLFNGLYLHTTGTYIEHFSSLSGCDSIVNLTLTIDSLPSISLIRTCYSDAGTYACWWSASFAAEFRNCDSVKWYFDDTLIATPRGDTLSLQDSHFTVENNLPGTIIPVVLFQPNIFCITGYNFCGETTLCDTITLVGEGINSIADDNDISIFPNPATDQLFIKTENIQPISTTIYDVNGRIIYTMPFKPEIDINQLSSGAYFVEVTSNEGITRKMFVKGPL